MVQASRARSERRDVDATGQRDAEPLGEVDGTTTDAANVAIPCPLHRVPSGTHMCVAVMRWIRTAELQFSALGEDKTHKGGIRPDLLS